MAADITRGDLVEFTDRPHADYPPADESLVRFGVAVESGTVSGVRVLTPDGYVFARHIYAASWAGWIPDSLEGIVAELGGGDGEGTCESD